MHLTIKGGTKMKRSWFILFFILLFPVLSYAGFWEQVQGVVKEATSSPKHQTQGQSQLSEAEINSGLKETLLIALKRAVNKAGQEGGFLNNPEIRIPPPPKVARVASLLRKVGLGGQVDAFEESMNHAAEKAALEAWPVFRKAAEDLTLQDVKQLLHGGDNAVTEYFRKKTWPELYEKFLPVVQENLNKVGVTRKYQELVSSPSIRAYAGQSDLQLDHYVTEKSLEGLFKLLGEEEKRIRKDPTARTTALLKKLFGKN